MDEKQKQMLVELYPDHDIDKVLNYVNMRYEEPRNPFALAERILSRDGAARFSNRKSNTNTADDGYGIFRTEVASTTGLTDEQIRLALLAPLVKEFCFTDLSNASEQAFCMGRLLETIDSMVPLIKDGWDEDVIKKIEAAGDEAQRDWKRKQAAARAAASSDKVN